MAEIQPYTAVCRGGLDLVSSPYELLRLPNVAKQLKNFEVSNEGGYRLINGFSSFGGGSAVKPSGSNRILGVYPYGLGVVVCVSDGIYYSEDGISWLQVNKDTSHAGSTETDIASDTELPRSVQGKAHFVLMKAPENHTNSTYGSLSIATGPNKLAHFHIEGIGSSRVFIYEEIGAPITAAGLIEYHDHHLCVVDTDNAPSTVYYSANDNDRDFTGSGSGSVTLADKIVGIKSFREDLIIFCENTIHRLVNINDPTNVAIVQITNNLGCLSGHTIQEIGGDLIYLSQDGFRTIAGTERIGDTELGTLSVKIDPIVENITSNVSSFTFSSTIIKSKDQYRVFYTDESRDSTLQKGLIGTVRPNDQGGLGFEWSETEGIEAYSISSGFDTTGLDTHYHGDLEGNVYIHDIGTSFNGSAIPYVYTTPDVDFGDAGLRKTLHYMLLSVKPEGATDIKLKVTYDFGSSSIISPPLQDVGVISAPSFFGSAIFGSSTFGTGVSPIKRINLRGSGTSSSFSFSGETTTGSFTISGFYITFVPIDRR